MLSKSLRSLRTKVEYKVLNKVKRNYKNSYKKNKSNTKKYKEKESETSLVVKKILQRIKALNIKRRFVFFVSIAISFFIFLFHFNQYNKFRVVELFPGENKESSRMIDNEEFNILFFVFEERKDKSYVISSLNLASINFTNDTINMVGINPSFTVNGENSLKEVLIKFSLKEGKINNLVEQVELLTGLRIDRYIAFNKGNLINLIDINDISTRKVVQVKGSDKIELSNNITIANIITDSNLSQKYSEDDLTGIYAQLAQDFISHISKFNLYKMFWKDQNGLFYTDFKKREFTSFLSQLTDASKKINLILLTSEFGTKENDMLTPSIAQIDEEIQKIFRNLLIISEQSEIEIFNATGVRGLATKTTRQLENIGMRVVRAGNFGKFERGNILYVTGGDVEPHKNTINSIRRLLNGNLVIKFEGYKQNYSGDLVLILGE